MRVVLADYEKQILKHELKEMWGKEVKIAVEELKECVIQDLAKDIEFKKYLHKVFRDYILSLKEAKTLSRRLLNRSLQS